MQQPHVLFRLCTRAWFATPRNNVDHLVAMRSIDMLHKRSVLPHCACHALMQCMWSAGPLPEQPNRAATTHMAQQGRRCACSEPGGGTA